MLPQIEFDTIPCHRLRRVYHITYRNLMSTASTTFHTRLVKYAELNAALLPAHSARVTPEERVAQLHTRFDSIRRRYGL